MGGMWTWILGGLALFMVLGFNLVGDVVTTAGGSDWFINLLSGLTATT